MILSFLFFAFLAYLLFKLVFNFIIPIYKTTKQVKKSFREMSARMNQPNGQKMQQGANGSSTDAQHQTSHDKNKKTPVGDYIDFEEVKD